MPKIHLKRITEMIRLLKYLFFCAFGLVVTSSCVPLAIGAAGVAGGYMARNSGVGVVEPADSQNGYEY